MTLTLILLRKTIAYNYIFLESEEQHPLHRTKEFQNNRHFVNILK